MAQTGHLTSIAVCWLDCGKIVWVETLPACVSCNNTIHSLHLQVVVQSLQTIIFAREQYRVRIASKLESRSAKR